MIINSHTRGEFWEKFRWPNRVDLGLTQELAHFASDDDKVVGLLLRDNVDRDYSWVAAVVEDFVVTPKAGGQHSVDHPTYEDALDTLHGAMLMLHDGEI